MNAPVQLVDGVLNADGEVQRRHLAKAITLLESTREDHRTQADDLLTALLPHTGRSLRVGLSGVPGVGKSTLIESLGLWLIDQGHKVAVLAIDPSSSVSGGSILGDKTRMEHLSVKENAFIRPSPSSGTLGGVAEKTRECMLLCEAAGYDVIIVETVGVGQSETTVSGMTDMFVMMQLPNAGDDLQAIKKGVMELADLVLINKVDLDEGAAHRAQAFIESAMRLFHAPRHMADANALPEWIPNVLTLSALEGRGLENFWNQVVQFKKIQQANGQWLARRHTQSLTWMNERINTGLKQAFYAHPHIAQALPRFTKEVSEGRLAPSTAARQLLGMWI
jgi:LAO/AO transport system kinase